MNKFSKGITPSAFVSTTEDFESLNPLFLRLRGDGVFRGCLGHAIHSTGAVLHVHPVEPAGILKQLRSERRQNHLDVLGLPVDQAGDTRAIPQKFAKVRTA